MLFCALLYLVISTNIDTELYRLAPVNLIGDEAFYLEISTDMLAVGDRFYIVENRAHRVQVFSLGDEMRHVGMLADKGEGPGEVWLPFSLAEWRDRGVVVKDNRGLSLFDVSGTFLERFRVYTPPIGLTTHGDQIFYMTPRSDSQDLIDVYEPDGTMTRRIFPRYMGLDGDDASLLRHINYFYRGPLLSDKEYLYYLSATRGDLFRLNPDGETIDRRSIVDEIGPTADFIQKKVSEYMKDPGQHLVPEGFVVYHLFQDAYLANGKIYVLRWGSTDPDYFSRRNDILVFDTTDLRLSEHIQFEMERGERVWSFAVWDTGEQRRILLSMRTNRNDDYQLLELVP